MNSLEEMIKKLPPEYQKEVYDFIQFLIERRKPKLGKKLKQDWAGALRDYREQFTSLELQKKALEGMEGGQVLRFDIGARKSAGRQER